jgi:hypothetical protein
MEILISLYNPKPSFYLSVVTFDRRTEIRLGMTRQAVYFALPIDSVPVLWCVAHNLECHISETKEKCTFSS